MIVDKLKDSFTNQHHCNKLAEELRDVLNQENIIKAYNKFLHKHLGTVRLSEFQAHYVNGLLTWVPLKNTDLKTNPPTIINEIHDFSDDNYVASNYFFKSPLKTFHSNREAVRGIEYIEAFHHENDHLKVLLMHEVFNKIYPLDSIWFYHVGLKVSFVDIDTELFKESIMNGMFFKVGFNNFIVQYSDFVNQVDTSLDELNTLFRSYLLALDIKISNSCIELIKNFTSNGFKISNLPQKSKIKSILSF